MLAIIMSIAVVFDISEKLEDFLQNTVPLKEVVFRYYLNFIFYYGNLFSSLLIFLSVLLFTSQMAQRTEIVAIWASGVSFNRLLRPYMIAATILVGISLYFTHYQLPIANQERIAFEEDYIKRTFTISDKNLHRQIEKNTIAYFESFSTINSLGYKFSLEKWDSNGKLKSKLMADRAIYDSLNGKWRMENYYVREFLGDKEKLRTGIRLDTLINMKPSDFGQRLSYASMMSYEELSGFIEEEKLKGSDKVVYYEIEKHQRTSYPVAAYVLTIIGVSMASRKVRGGIGMHLALGVLIAVIYIFAMKVTTVAATNAGLDPFIAVWLPNILFASVALFIYTKAQK